MRSPPFDPQLAKAKIKHTHTDIHINAGKVTEEKPIYSVSWKH